MLVEPKWVTDAKKGGGGGDKFMRKESSDEAGKKKRGKDGEEAGGAKNVTGLALELQRLEDRLRSTISLEPNKAVDNKRRSVRGSKESRR